MQPVRVLNLRTGAELLYCGPTPAEAVVCAHEQSKGNFNTWDYDFDQAQSGPSGRTVACGDFAAVTDPS